MNSNDDEGSAAEPSHIDSTLRWQDVSLPASVSLHDLDTVITASLTSRWQKTAMVVGNALSDCSRRGLPVTDAMIGARIGALAEAGLIESAGDLRAWRHSEVRLKN